MIQDAGENHLKTYRQATVAEWVALWPIFDVCMKETGYGGGAPVSVVAEGRS